MNMEHGMIYFQAVFRLVLLSLLVVLGFHQRLSASPQLASGFIFSDVLDGMAFRVEQVANGFKIPWGIAFLNEDELLVTERSGGLYYLNLHTRSIKPISHDLPVFVKGQGGLLDVAIGPGINWVYLTYVRSTTDGSITVLCRAQWKSNMLTSWETLLHTDSATDTSRHFGSRIAFDDKGHVFFGIGDRGHRPNGQDLGTHAGKILRLKLDGSIPSDNPFVDTSGSLKEIWSYGHRNPQGLFYDQKKNQLWEIEHGPRGGDEINLIVKAANYGWPILSYGKEYWAPVAVGEAEKRPGYIDPVKVYIPSIAPGSLIVYQGTAFKEWQGRLIAGALKLQHINLIAVNDNGLAISEKRIIAPLKQRIRAVKESPAGWIYFSTDQGNLYRLRP